MKWDIAEDKRETSDLVNDEQQRQALITRITALEQDLAVAGNKDAPNFQAKQKELLTLNARLKALEKDYQDDLTELLHPSKDDSAWISFDPR